MCWASHERRPPASTEHGVFGTSRSLIRGCEESPRREDDPANEFRHRGAQPQPLLSSHARTSISARSAPELVWVGDVAPPGDLCEVRPDIVRSTSAPPGVPPALAALT